MPKRSKPFASGASDPHNAAARPSPAPWSCRSSFVSRFQASRNAKPALRAKASNAGNEVATFEGLQFAGLSDFWSTEFGRYGARAPRGAPDQPDSGQTPAERPEARTAVQAILLPGYLVEIEMWAVKARE